MKDHRQITGVIIAGGRSLRMAPAFDGLTDRDKALLDLAGRPMLAHVIERLAPQVGRLVVNANGDPARFAHFGLPVVADTVGGFAGPLAGVLAGMRWSAANAPEATHLATVSADTPFLPRDLVTRLSNAEAPLAIASTAGLVHPVIGLWPVALADELEVALVSGFRKAIAWAEARGAVTVDFPFLLMKGLSIDPFFNANTPEELMKARALLENDGAMDGAD